MRLLFLLSSVFIGSTVRAYDTIRFLDPIKADEMARPIAVAASATRLFVLDEKKSQLYIYDADGKLIKVAGRHGFDKAAFATPQGLAIGPTGRVFVADTGNNRVQILDSDGNFLSSFGAKGAEAGMLKSPESVAVGADGRVFVADTGNNRVQVFTQEGILLFQFGGGGKEPGQFKSPTKVAVDPSDNIYVLDSGNDRIQKFDAAAKFVKEYTLSGNDVAVDDYGFIYILDAKNGKVIEQNAEGFVLGRFGSAGSGVGQYKKPEALAIAPGGAILVVDTGNNRLHKVEITNKLKVAPLPQNLATKMFVSGPSRSWTVAAGALAAFGDDLYAYLPKEGQFVLLGPDGGEKGRFGTRQGKGPSITKDSQGLAASKKFGVYVSDTPNDRVQQFDLGGQWKANIAEATGVFDSKKKEGRVKSPRGIAINDQGTIYVADAGNRRIDAFSPEGVFLFGIGPKVGALELSEPVAVAWDKARFVYFVDKGLKKVIKTEPSGAFLAAWGEEGSGPGQFQEPVALAFDGHNYLYVLDARLKRVSVWSKDGRWLTDLFSGGKEERQLLDPVSLSVQGPRLLIADKGKGKLVTFDLHPFLAPPSPVSATAKEGVVSLSWPAVADPWTEGYRVLRSTAPYGPFAEIGRTEETQFQDASVAAYGTYYYRVATEAKTKDVGAAGAAQEVYVAGAFNRPPVEISSVAIGNVFSANYKWYLKNPIGTALVSNNVNVPFQNVKLSFRLKDFMDFGYDTELKKLEPQQAVEVPLIATLNNKILEVTEDTPIQAELSLTYFESGKPQTVSLTKPLRVYSRNAITWEDPRRIANFITPKDTPILEFGREVLRLAPQKGVAEVLNPNVVTVMLLWSALGEAGVRFVTNPTSPYETISEDPNFPVDYTQFPRETLKRKSGQCSDLTTLIVSMLESGKARTAILDYPGHMALMFDTETDDLAAAGLAEEDLIFHEGTYWVPLEATLIGRPFPEAVRKAAYAYKAEKEAGKVTVIDVRSAWASFEPATLPASDWSPELPKKDAIEKRFDSEGAAVLKDRYASLKKHYGERLKANPLDLDARVSLGVLEYQNGNKESAVEEFNKAAASDPKNASALNNLGNVAFLAGDYAGAEKQYLRAVESEPGDPDILMNLVKTEVKLKNKAKAEEYGQKAVAADSRLQPAVDTLLKGL